jgi:hypothetical protein
MRFVGFAADIKKHLESCVSDEEMTVDYCDPSTWAKFAEKHDIPGGVHPLWCEAIQVENVKEVSAHIRKWVRGILSPSDCDLLKTYAEIWKEYDLGWVFMGLPSFNYMGEKCRQRENAAQFVQIGTRNYKGEEKDLTIELTFMGAEFKPTRRGIGRPKGT